MKKYRLEDIGKRQVFTKPPDGYFERLPGVIQAKTAHKSSNRRLVYWVGALKMVPVAALLILIALYTGILNHEKPTPGFETMLSEVNSEDIIWYLEELDLTNDEILQEVDLAVLSLQLDEMQDPLMDNLEIGDDELMQLYDDFDSQDSLL